jgi:hypothetical protein
MHNVIVYFKPLSFSLHSKPANSHLHKRQWHVMKQLNEKLRLNNLSVIPTDKGKTMVILDKNTLDDKVRQFLTQNQFSRLHTHPTDKYKKHLQQILQSCNSIINKQQAKYLTQKQPTPPMPQACIKLHNPPSRQSYQYTNVQDSQTHIQTT